MSATGTTTTPTHACITMLAVITHKSFGDRLPKSDAHDKNAPMATSS
jgi:hypothetical protein